jgi:hypothetical protein
MLVCIPLKWFEFVISKHIFLLMHLLEIAPLLLLQRYCSVLFLYTREFIVLLALVSRSYVILPTRIELPILFA